MNERDRDCYWRQIRCPGIGMKGHQRLGAARVAIVGCGALGSFQAGARLRAGVRGLVLIDRDYVVIRAFWEELEFTVQEIAWQDWKKMVDTSLQSPDDFSEKGVALQHATCTIAPKWIVVLLRPRITGSCSNLS